MKYCVIPIGSLLASIKMITFYMQYFKQVCLYHFMSSSVHISQVYIGGLFKVMKSKELLKDIVCCLYIPFSINSVL